MSVIQTIIWTLPIASCQSSLPIQQLPEIHFSNLPLIKLNVESIDIVSQYEPPFNPPYIEHIMPTPPERAARQWARDRLEAVGGNSLQHAIFIIRQAPVIERRLATDTDFKSYFRQQQSKHYSAHIDVVLEIRDNSGRLLGDVVSIADRSRTVVDTSTANERDYIWHEMVGLLIMDMNKTLEEAIRGYLTEYLVSHN